MFKKIALAGGVAAMLMGSTAYASVIDRPFFQVLGVVVVWGADDFGTAGTAPVVSDFVLLTPASGAGVDLIGGAAVDGYSVVTGTLDPIEGDETGNADDPSTFDPITGTGSGNFTDNGSSGVLDAADVMSSFGIDNTTDVNNIVGQHKSSFFVASNAPFDIAAQSTNIQATGGFAALTYDNIGLEMSSDAAGTNGTGNLSYGSAAQVPTTGFVGSATVADLGDITTQTKVFEVDQRTAATVGSIAEQSIRINSVYTLDADAGTAGVQGYDLSMGVGTISADVTYTVFVP